MKNLQRLVDDFSLAIGLHIVDSLGVEFEGSFRYGDSLVFGFTGVNLLEHVPDVPVEEPALVLNTQVRLQLSLVLSGDVLKLDFSRLLIQPDVVLVIRSLLAFSPSLPPVVLLPDVVPLFHEFLGSQVILFQVVILPSVEELPTGKPGGGNNKVLFSHNIVFDLHVKNLTTDIIEGHVFFLYKRKPLAVVVPQESTLS